MWSQRPVADFFSELKFPDVTDEGLRVTCLGARSVTYKIGLFRRGSDEPAALGGFVHVWVDRETRRPVPVPPKIRRVPEPLVVEA